MAERYRVRRGWFGRAVLQVKTNSPSWIGGFIEPELRIMEWLDVPYDEAPAELVDREDVRERT
jgi:hypothetical protein